MHGNFGINKAREMERLVYEITRRDGRAPQLDPKWNFDKTKKYLLALRYPKTYKTTPAAAYYLPKLNVGTHTDLCAAEFKPKYIYIDAAAENSVPALNAKRLFPGAEILKQFTRGNEYSKRTETLYISQEKYDFIKPCPCTPGARCCGYNLLNLGFGCAFECEYCFLQEYQNLNAVMLPANIDDFLTKINGTNLTKGPFDTLRIGSGEFTDSLIFDHISEYSKHIVPFFAARPGLTFEFKTKSVNIDNLLAMPAAKNVVVAWSVNAEEIIRLYEHHTPPLTARLAAARQITAHGYSTAFHFDPVILHKNWQKNYASVVEQIASAVPSDAVKWLSVGTLRFNRELKKHHEARFPHSHMLDEEFLLGYDNKLRYSDAARAEVYAFLIPLLRQTFPAAHVYTCMENAKI